MKSNPHLLVDISSHGYGHVSQTSALVNELLRLVPALRLTIRTEASIDFLKKRFHCDFEHISQSFDFGMKMANAVDVKVAESAAAYRAFHADWSQKIAREAQVMCLLKPDLLLANVPYLSLAAAQAANISAVGMCSLNWAEMYNHYCVSDAETQRIHGQILDAYQGADCFLKLQPAMPMPDLNNARSIHPIVRIGKTQRKLMDTRYSLEDEKLVVVAMGGMEFRLPVQNWPRLPGVRWIVPGAWKVTREDVIEFESLQMNFTDVLSSCDAVITKPGYGTFTEAAYAGVPVLYVSRGDWPEEPALVQWLRENNVCREVERAALHTGEFYPVLQQLWTLSMPARPDQNGALEAANYLNEHYF